MIQPSRSAAAGRERLPSERAEILGATAPPRDRQARLVDHRHNERGSGRFPATLRGSSTSGVGSSKDAGGPPGRGSWLRVVAERGLAHQQPIEHEQARIGLAATQQHRPGLPGRGDGPPCARETPTRRLAKTIFFFSARVRPPRQARGQASEKLYGWRSRLLTSVGPRTGPGRATCLED